MSPNRVYLSGARAAVREEVTQILKDVQRGRDVPDYRIAEIGMGAAQVRAVKAAMRAAAEKDHEGKPVAHVLALGNIAHEIAASLDEDFAPPRERDQMAALDGDPEALKRVREYRERDALMESLADEIISSKNRKV